MRSLLFILFLVAGTSVQAQTKVGFTNVELIMYHMPEVTAVNESLEEYERAKMTEIKEDRELFTTLIQEYQEKTQLPSFSGSTEETELINTISALESKIKQREANYQYEASMKRNELMQPLLNKLQAAIDAVAEENGYTYILNQTSGTNILYGVEQFDVTQLIAAKLGITIPK